MAPSRVVLNASLPGPKLLGAGWEAPWHAQGDVPPVSKDPLFIAPGPVLPGMWGLWKSDVQSSCNINPTWAVAEAGSGM